MDKMMRPQEGTNRPEFSVAQFFDDGSWKYVRQGVSGETAMLAFKDQIRSPAAKAGIIARVIVTDGGDFINVEWKYGKGITYPTVMG